MCQQVESLGVCHHQGDVVNVSQVCRHEQAVLMVSLAAEQSRLMFYKQFLFIPYESIKFLTFDITAGS